MLQGGPGGAAGYGAAGGPVRSARGAYSGPSPGRGGRAPRGRGPPAGAQRYRPY
jgi:hypothetical protein